MLMPPGLRKLALTVHVAVSLALLGAIAGFLVLAVAGLTASDAATQRAAYPAMALVTWYAILPLVFGSLASGIVQSFGTNWGLFRHYWVLAKLVLTILATAVLLLQVGLIDFLAAAAVRAPLPDDLLEARMSLVAHAGGGLLVLLLPVVLSIYKPRGRTPWGTRSPA